MMWELLALWAVVLSVVVWFIRDERSRRAAALIRASAPAGKASPGTLPMIAQADPARAAAARRRFIQAMVAKTD